MKQFIQDIVDEIGKLGFEVIDQFFTSRTPYNSKSIRFDIFVNNTNSLNIVDQIPYYWTCFSSRNLLRVIIDIPYSEMANLKEFQYLRLANRQFDAQIKDNKLIITVSELV